MEITFIMVIQNLFLASIILMAFSIPKTIMIIIWMKYSTWIFSGGALKMLDHKRYGSILKKHMPQITIDKLKDDDSTINQIVKNQKRALEEIKIPMIEAVTSIILMLVSLRLWDRISQSWMNC